MNSYLTISHMCLLCLPSGGTLLFWSDLFVNGRVVSWERWESAELGRWESGEGSELGRLIKGYSVPREFSWIENYKLSSEVT